MKPTDLSSRTIEALLTTLETQQKEKLLRLAQQHVPNMTLDDLLQPNDFLVLEQDPTFRYEEGFLAALLAFRAAFYALCAEKK